MIFIGGVNLYDWEKVAESAVSIAQEPSKTLRWQYIFLQFFPLLVDVYFPVRMYG